MKSMIQIGQWKVDAERNIIDNGQQQHQLEQKPLELLMLLAEHAGQDVSKAEIFARVWAGKVVTEDVIYVAINALRKAFNDKARSPCYIKTISGYGYRLIAEVSHPEPRAKGGLTKAFIASAGVIAVLLSVVLLWNLPVSAPQSQQDLAGDTLAQYQEATYLINQHDLSAYPQAITLLQEVISIAPQYAPAYVQLAKAKMANLFNGDPQLLKDKKQIEGILLHALSLAPDNKLAKVLLANLYFIAFHQHEKANALFQQALPEAYSHYFYSQFLLAMGEFEQALQHTQWHIQQYPSEYSKEAVAWIYTMNQEYDVALKEITKLQKYAQSNVYYHVSLQAIYELKGQQEHAFNELLWLMENAGYAESDISQVKSAFAKDQLAGVYHWLAFVDSKQLPLGQYQPPLSLARYAIVAGQHGQALTWLEQAYESRHPAVLWLAADPKYAPLRDEPRFNALLSQLGLPQG